MMAPNRANRYISTVRIGNHTGLKKEASADQLVREEKMKRTERPRRHFLFTESFPCRLLSLLILLLLATPCPGASAEEDEKDGDESTETGSELLTPLLGWGREDDRRFHYLTPIYYHSTKSRHDSSTTLVFPLLTGFFDTGKSITSNLYPEEKVRLDGAVSLPLLAFWGSLEGESSSGSGYASPYFSAVTLDLSWDGIETSRSRASILPILQSFRLDLYNQALLATESGEFSRFSALSLPGLDFDLYDSRNAGIESDFSFINIWGISLYRETTDLPGAGFSPWLRQFEPLESVSRHHLLAGLGVSSSRSEDRLRVLGILADSRSGAPVDHTGLLDPMITLERRGESLKAVGIEPLFHYDSDAGLSLPLLLANFSGDGIRFGSQAARHLFPILHGNAEGTRWDFLLNYGTVYNL